MKRRAFVAGLSVVLLAPNMAMAETATPTVAEKKYIRDFLGDVTLPSRVGFRSFDAPNPGLLGEGLLWFWAYGMEFRNTVSAKAFVLAFPDAFRQWELWGRDPKLEGTAIRPASVRKLGDMNWAWTFTVTTPKSDLSWEWGITAIMQGTWVQILAGSTFAGSSIVHLADIAGKTLARWPNKESASLKEGLFIGDVFSSLPVLADVPEGVTIDEDVQIHF
jgi:hypothetical protein